MNLQHMYLVVLLLGGAPAWADQVPDLPASGSGQEGGEWMLGPVAPDDLLDQQRGRQTVFNTNDVDGQLHNNDAVSNVTGSNFVTDGSFSGMSGFSTVIQNSGNNVLIQNATVLNLQFQ